METDGVPYLCPILGGKPARDAARREGTLMRRALAKGFALALVLLLLLPTAILVGETRLPALGAVWRLADSRHALFTTLVSGAVALFVIAGLGIPAAWILARMVSGPTQGLVGTLLAIPLLVPPLVLGLVLAYILGPTTPVGGFFNHMGISPTESLFSLTVAEVYEGFPYFLVTAWAAFRAVPVAYEEEARVLGKSPVEVFQRVTWPMARNGVIVAGAMAWARITGAFGAPIVVAYHPTALPVAIWIALESYGLPSALALSTILLAVGLPAPIWLNWRNRHVRSH